MRFAISLLMVSLLVSCAERADEPLVVSLEEGWSAVQNARFVEGSHTDGDSIHVEHDGKETIFRLYWVDTLEKNPRSVDRRVAQARYFGIQNQPNEAGMELAEEAKEFTRRLLSRPFVVLTKWEKVDPEGDNPSIRAYIKTAQGDLGGLLVVNGLALVKGGSAEAPGPEGASVEDVRAGLHQDEKTAREARRGGWALAEDRSVKALPAGTLAATDREALLRAVGTEIEVHGVVSRVGSSASMAFVNFAGCARGDFVVVARLKAFRAPKNAPPIPWLEEFIGKTVRVKGEIATYQGAPQIVLTNPEQIRATD